MIQTIIIEIFVMKPKKSRLLFCFKFILRQFLIVAVYSLQLTFDRLLKFLSLALLCFQFICNLHFFIYIPLFCLSSFHQSEFFSSSISNFLLSNVQRFLIVTIFSRFTRPCRKMGTNRSPTRLLGSVISTVRSSLLVLTSLKAQNIPCGTFSSANGKSNGVHSQAGLRLQH